MWVLLILVVLWVLVAPLIALVSASAARRRADALARRLAALEVRLSDLGAPAARPYGPSAAAFRPSPPEARAPGTPASAPSAPAALPETTPPPTAATAEPSPSPSEAETPPPEPEALQPEAEAPPSAPPPPPPPPAAQPRPRESLEAMIGGRWTVLVGGLALALGAVFLVRYTIEQGLLGPGVRIALAALLSALLFGAGEWLRRRDRALNVPALAQADVPAILTAAGGVAAFATVFAAHALYGFIGTGAAFVLLTAVGLATLFLSVLHGPALAGLGALGSYVAPLLVASTAPNPIALALHTLAVTAAALAMARIRGWHWLAASGVAASLIWGVVLAGIGSADTIAAELLLAAGLAVIFVAALVAETGPALLRDRPANGAGLGALAGLALLTVYFAQTDPDYPALASGVVLTGVLGAVASRWTAMAGAALIGGVLAVATVTLMPPAVPLGYGPAELGDLAWTTYGEAGLGAFALRAAAIALLVGAGSFLSADRFARTAPRTAGLFAAAGAGAPLLILIVVYLRHVPFETRPVIGIAALVLATVFAAMTERLIARRPRDDTAPAPALCAAGAVLALSLACGVGSPRASSRCRCRSPQPESSGSASTGLSAFFRGSPWCSPRSQRLRSRPDRHSRRRRSERRRSSTGSSSVSACQPPPCSSPASRCAAAATAWRQASSRPSGCWSPRSS